MTVIFILLLQTGILAFKNASSKLVVNPIHTTTTGKWMSAGNFKLFKMGGISAFGINAEGREGTIIVPSTSITKLGNSIACNVRVMKSTYEELPTEVQDVITEWNYPEPFYLGYINEEQEMNRPELIYIVHELKEKNKYLSMVKSIMGDKFKTVEGAVSFSGRITDRAKGGIAKNIGRMIFENKKEND